MKRYQFIDTQTGEVIRESSIHPMLSGLNRQPRRTVQYKVIPDLIGAVVLVLLLGVIFIK